MLLQKTKILKSKFNTYKQNQFHYKMIQNSAFNNKITKKVSLLQVNRNKTTIK